MCAAEHLRDSDGLHCWSRVQGGARSPSLRFEHCTAQTLDGLAPAAVTFRHGWMRTRSTRVGTFQLDSPYDGDSKNPRRS